MNYHFESEIKLVEQIGSVLQPRFIQKAVDSMLFKAEIRQSIIQFLGR